MCAYNHNATFSQPTLCLSRQLLAYSTTAVNTADNVMSSSGEQHLNYSTSAELTAAWKITYLVGLCGCVASLTTNPVIPVYSVDVVSRISEDWGPANICCCAYAAGPFCSSQCVCECDVHNGLDRGVWVPLAPETSVSVLHLRQNDLDTLD